jgi:hypothetical protein
LIVTSVGWCCASAAGGPLTDRADQWLSARATRALKRPASKPSSTDRTGTAPAPLVGCSPGPWRDQRQANRALAAHPELTERARALVPVAAQHDVVPWERLHIPQDVDRSHGTFRAPEAPCTLSAADDCEAVQAWLGLRESVATQRAYCKEAERLILWAVLERGRTLSSLPIEGAGAYWVFPPRKNNIRDGNIESPR